MRSMRTSQMEDIAYFEYIVVGLGGIGSAALYWLAKRSGKGEAF